MEELTEDWKGIPPMDLLRRSLLMVNDADALLDFPRISCSFLLSALSRSGFSRLLLEADNGKL